MVPDYIYICANTTDANVSLVQNSIVFPHLLGGYYGRRKEKWHSIIPHKNWRISLPKKIK